MRKTGSRVLINRFNGFWGVCAHGPRSLGAFSDVTRGIATEMDAMVKNARLGGVESTKWLNREKILLRRGD